MNKKFSESKGICYIIGASPDNSKNFLKIIDKKPNDYIIAADGGYDTLLKNGIVPDVVIGDLDSVKTCEGRISCETKVIRYPVKKDDTDAALAVEYALGQGYRNIVMYGMTGGRLDHTIANIQLLANVSKRGVEAKIVADDLVMAAITNGELHLGSENQGIISIFSHSDVALGVTIKGLLYEVFGVTLTNDVALGISNEFVGEESVISVAEGTLIVMYGKRYDKEYQHEF